MTIKASDRDPEDICSVEDCHAWRKGESIYCRHHKGLEKGPKASDGAPEGNQNAATHSLYSDRDAYYQDLSEREQAWVHDFTHDLLDRQRRMLGREPDMFDKEALKNIAIDFHRIAHANGWFRERGIAPKDYKVTPQGGVVEAGKKVNEWAKEIRQYNESIYRRMEKHGLLSDPESQKAEATRTLAEVLSED